MADCLDKKNHPKLPGSWSKNLYMYGLRFSKLTNVFLKVLKFMANCVHLKNHLGTFGMYLVWKISQDFPAIR